MPRLLRLRLAVLLPAACLLFVVAATLVLQVAQKGNSPLSGQLGGGSSLGGNGGDECQTANDCGVSWANCTSSTPPNTLTTLYSCTYDFTQQRKRCHSTPARCSDRQAGDNCPQDYFCSNQPISPDECAVHNCDIGLFPICTGQTCREGICMGQCCKCVPDPPPTSSSAVSSAAVASSSAQASSSLASSSRQSSSAAASSSLQASSSSASSCPLLLPPAPPPNCHYDIANPTYGPDGCVLSYPLVCTSSQAAFSSSQSINSSSAITDCMLTNEMPPANSGWRGDIVCDQVCTAGAVSCHVSVKNETDTSVGSNMPGTFRGYMQLGGAIRRTRGANHGVDYDLFINHHHTPIFTIPGSFPAPGSRVEWNKQGTLYDAGSTASGDILLQRGWAPFSLHLRVCVNNRPVVDITPSFDGLSCPVTAVKSLSCIKAGVQYGLHVGLAGAKEATVIDDTLSPASCVQSLQNPTPPKQCTVSNGHQTQQQVAFSFSCSSLPMNAQGSATATFDTTLRKCTQTSLSNNARVTFYNFTDINDVPAADGSPSGGEVWFQTNTLTSPLPVCAASSAGAVSSATAVSSARAVSSSRSSVAVAASSSATSSGGGNGQSSSAVQTQASSSAGASSSEDQQCLFRTLGLPAPGCYWQCTGAAATDLCLPCSQNCFLRRSSSSSSRATARASSSAAARASSASSAGVAVAQCRGNECQNGGDAYCNERGYVCQNITDYPCTVCVQPTASSAAMQHSQSSASTSTLFLAPSRSCGNGELNTGEMCDDGNNVSGDGCTAACEREAGKPPQVVHDAPAVAMATCGNRKIEAGEQCDDGNPVSGDGCSASCLGEVLGQQAGVWLPASPTGSLHMGQEFSLQGSSTNPSFTTLQASAEPIVVGHAPAGKTGPASVVFMAAGAAGGWAWMRRRRRKS